MSESDIVIRVPPARVTAQVMPVTVRLSNAMWLRWAEIAVENENAAYMPRIAGNRDAPGDELTDEQKASMISMTAAAHAVDSLYGRFRALIPVDKATLQAWREKKLARESVIIETLKLGFNVHFGPHRNGRNLGRDLKWLFEEARDPIHYSETVQDLAPHPYYRTYVNPDVAFYTAETATKAVDVMLAVMGECLSSPKSETERDASAMYKHIGRLVERRSALMRGVPPSVR